ncbi:acyloxyacyl hydrolase [Aureispira anguillae]|uniref:Acyloxyacyl hydrolase n=1 Tax=Aureispira anguillae TaxID=2864201 RepID=A0A916DVB0_9BACT|nr:acyloxyacyl hydrolase [Aureispira anguillae]BDS14181.1 acyloxyacyl hydrolase [Aureispira anguillae]
MRLLWIGLLLMSAYGLLAQKSSKGMYIEGSFHFGKAFKHRSTITIDLPDFSYGTELNFEIKTYGKKHWHERCGFPRWGLAVAYQYSGNAEQMGHCIAILPNVTVDFFRHKKIRLFGRLGVGLGLITKPFDRQTNPLNNMVGSYLNNNTSLRLGMAWRIHKNIELRPSATFNHYSNAASTLPNLGINIPSFQLGICYMPNPVEEEDYIKVAPSERPQRSKRVQFSAVFSMGFRELSPGSNLKYPIWHSSVDAGLFITRNNRLKAGIEYDYIGSSYAFTKHNGGYQDKDLHWEASRITLFVADEIMIGRFAILAQLGFYVTQNVGQPWFMSIRLSGRYYFMDPYLNPATPFVTVTMKSHKIIAEYFSIGLGAAF